MKRFLCIAAFFFALLCPDAHAVVFDLQPAGEYLFAKRDTCDLFRTVYAPDKTTAKPSISFTFGGGFVEGDRNARAYLPWFKRYTEEGYRIITIDYRLGMKGAGKPGVGSIEAIYNAIEMGVEDLFSATSFIIDNAEALGVDPSKLVLSGSSAGAIIALQAEWHLSNRSGLASRLPEDFRFAGVMAFAGAILSREGKIRFAKQPCPVLFFHGTEDKIVNYNKITFFKNRFEGSRALAAIFAKNSYNYNIYRYDGNQHEIASSFMRNFPEQLRFLEQNVIKGERRIVDATVSDPSIKIWKVNSTRELYKGN